MAFVIADSYTFEATPEEVWSMIFDAGSLKDLIPGCKTLTQNGEDVFCGDIVIGVAAVSGTYNTVVEIAEKSIPSYAKLVGEVTGPTGSIIGEAIFRLKEVNGLTEFSYNGQATITGALAKMNPRFIEGIATTLAHQGLLRFEKQLTMAQAASNDA